MQYVRFGTQCAIAIVTALITLHFAPHSWRVSGVSAVFVGILLAELFDLCFSPFWIATRKAASCGCSKVMKKVARLPKLLDNQCGNCGAEMA
jgi:hypothetical protein